MRDYTDSNAHGYILTYLYIGRFLSILNGFSYYSIFRNERIFTGGGGISIVCTGEVIVSSARSRAYSRHHAPIPYYYIGMYNNDNIICQTTGQLPSYIYLFVVRHPTHTHTHSYTICECTQDCR